MLDEAYWAADGEKQYLLARKGARVLELSGAGLPDLRQRLPEVTALLEGLT